jgi:hypothetical protein
MQAMPHDGLDTNFNYAGKPCFASLTNTEEFYDPELFVSFGTHMLAELIQPLAGRAKFYGLKVRWKWAIFMLI